MNVGALVELLSAIESAGITVWLDGGWGIDALLERQTRPHKDVDIIVQRHEASSLVQVLASRGFAIRAGALPDAFTLADDAGLPVDVHTVAFDARGNATHLMDGDRPWVFPAGSFDGRGAVGGMRVRCLSPAAQVLCHAQGYLPRDKDFQDMKLLQERFELDLPPTLRDR